MIIIARFIDGKLKGYQKVSEDYPEDLTDPSNAYTAAKEWEKLAPENKTKTIKEENWNPDDYEQYIPPHQETKLEELERRIIALENK